LTVDLFPDFNKKLSYRSEVVGSLLT